MRKLHLPVIMVAFGRTLALAQNASPPEQSAVFPVGPGTAGDLSGHLYVGDLGGGESIVVLALDGTSEGDAHPSHLHAGNCGSGGGVEIPLATVEGGSGLGVTVVQVGFDDLLTRDYHVNAHRSADDIASIVACGEVGAGAGTPLTTTVQADTAAADRTGSGTDDAPRAGEDPEGTDDAGAAQATLRSQSYQLFPVEGGGVSGTLNVTERVEGGTHFVVTLVGIERALYTPVLFSGDCGPDRDEVLRLPPLPTEPDDPFTSISDGEIAFEELTDGDYFMYIYPGYGEAEDEPLACGEVGEGANR